MYRNKFVVFYDILGCKTVQKVHKLCHQISSVPLPHLFLDFPRLTVAQQYVSSGLCRWFYSHLPESKNTSNCGIFRVFQPNSLVLTILDHCASLPDELWIIDPPTEFVHLHDVD